MAQPHSDKYIFALFRALSQPSLARLIITLRNGGKIRTKIRQDVRVSNVMMGRTIELARSLKLIHGGERRNEKLHLTDLGARLAAWYVESLTFFP